MSSLPTLAPSGASGHSSQVHDTQGWAESKLCPHPHLPLQTALFSSPRAKRMHTNGLGPLGSVRPVGRLQAVWAGNSEVQKLEKSPLILVLLGSDGGIATCHLVLHTLPLPFPVSGAWSKSLPSYPRTEQQLLLHLLLSAVVHPGFWKFLIRLYLSN